MLTDQLQHEKIDFTNQYVTLLFTRQTVEKPRPALVILNCQFCYFDRTCQSTPADKLPSNGRLRALLMMEYYSMFHALPHTILP